MTCLSEQYAVSNNTREIAQWIVDNCVVLDTETTGLGENDAVIELAAVRIRTGEVLVNTLINPEWLISPGAQKIHQIQLYELVDAPFFPDVWDQLQSEVGTFEFYTAFNLVFDERLIRQTAFKSGATVMPFDRPGLICIMELANRHFAKDYAEWNEEKSCFRRLSLARCCEIAGVEFDGRAHRALADAKAAAELVKAIAEGVV